MRVFAVLRVVVEIVLSLVMLASRNDVIASERSERGNLTEKSKGEDTKK